LTQDVILGEKYREAYPRHGSHKQLMTYLHSENSQAGNSGSAEDITALAQRARAGDKRAFEQLLELFHGPIYRLVYYRTRSSMDAEDLTQEIFILAYKNLSKLRESERFRPWLFRIAVNRVRDFNRKKRFLSLFGFSNEEDERDCYDLEADDSPQALEELLKCEFWQHVKRLSDGLSPMEREVFLLRFVDQLGIKEIAGVLKKSESAIKTHLYRALKKFKDDSELHEMLEGGIL
jgi:RNA polymerase sigma-70 factor (ECF subfamily)